MHHLINELRPHQARESIRVMMQSHKRQRFETTARLNKQIERVNDLIAAAVNAIQDQSHEDSLAQIAGLTKGSLALTDEHLKSDDSTVDINYQLDALMCDLVDEI